MHRTQIYFEEDFFKELKYEANKVGISISAYIREIVKKHLHNQKKKRGPLDLSEFSGMWKDREINQEFLRKKAWK